MNALVAELLVGLYFIGHSLSGLFADPIKRSVVVQLIFGIILVVLAYLGISLIR